MQDTETQSAHPIPQWTAIAVVVVALAAAGGVAWWYFVSDEGGGKVYTDPNLRQRPATQPAGFQALLDASKKGEVEKVRRLLVEHPEWVTTRSRDGHTALHAAVWEGRGEVVSALIDAGSGLEVHDGQYDGTPLQWAIVAGRGDMAQLLMQHGAKVDADLLDGAEVAARGEFVGYGPIKIEGYLPLPDMIRKAGAKENAHSRYLAMLRDAELAPGDAASDAIEGTWTEEVEQRLGADGNLLASLLAVGVKAKRMADGLELTTPDGRCGVLTALAYAAPLSIDIEAMTDSNNLRVFFGYGEVIWNWERKPTELRVLNPATHVWAGAAGKGKIPQRQWVHIRWIIAADEMKLLVDGQERYAKKGDYSGVRGRVGIAPGVKSKVMVRSVKIEALSH